MGLGTIKESSVIYLAIQGGFIWDKKADQNHAYYREQMFKTSTDPEGKMSGMRKGAAYGDITGQIVSAKFGDHEKYGESIEITIDDKDGERYVVTAGTSNRFGQDINKMLLSCDLSKQIRIRPFQFPDKEDKTKFVTGCEIFVEGEKVKKDDLNPEGMPVAPEGFFKTAKPAQKQIFFLNLQQWFRGEIEENVIPKFAPLKPKEGKEATRTPNRPAPAGAESEQATSETEEAESSNEGTAEETPATTATEKPLTPLQKKKLIQAYSDEHYEGQKIPTLVGAKLELWYNAVMNNDELPWDENGAPDASEVAPQNIDDQLDALGKK